MKTHAFITLSIAGVVALIGLILYAAASGKPMRIGEIMFFAGLLAALLTGPQLL